MCMTRSATGVGDPGSDAADELAVDGASSRPAAPEMMLSTAAHWQRTGMGAARASRTPAHPLVDELRAGRAGKHTWSFTPNRLTILSNRGEGQTASLLMALLMASTVAAIPAAKPPKHAPNVVFIICDDLPRAAMTAYGLPARFDVMPNIRRMQDAEGGVAMQEAFTTSSLCSPSRAALVTGRYASRVQYASSVAAELRNVWNSPPDDGEDLAKLPTVHRGVLYDLSMD